MSTTLASTARPVSSLSETIPIWVGSGGSPAERRPEIRRHVHPLLEPDAHRGGRRAQHPDRARLLLALAMQQRPARPVAAPDIGQQAARRLRPAHGDDRLAPQGLEEAGPLRLVGEADIDGDRAVLALFAGQVGRRRRGAYAPAPAQDRRPREIGPPAAGTAPTRCGRKPPGRRREPPSTGSGRSRRRRSPPTRARRARPPFPGAPGRPRQHAASAARSGARRPVPVPVIAEAPRRLRHRRNIAWRRGDCEGGPPRRRARPRRRRTPLPTSPLKGGGEKRREEERRRRRSASRSGVGVVRAFSRLRSSPLEGGGVKAAAARPCPAMAMSASRRKISKCGRPADHPVPGASGVPGDRPAAGLWCRRDDRPCADRHPRPLLPGGLSPPDRGRRRAVRRVLRVFRGPVPHRHRAGGHRSAAPPFHRPRPADRRHGRDRGLGSGAVAHPADGRFRGRARRPRARRGVQRRLRRRAFRPTRTASSGSRRCPGTRRIWPSPSSTARRDSPASAASTRRPTSSTASSATRRSTRSTNAWRRWACRCSCTRSTSSPRSGSRATT